MAKETYNLDIRVMIRELFKYWYLIVIFIFISLCIGGSYIKMASRSYNIRSKIIISTERETRSMSQDEFLQGFELINPIKNFGDEIQIIQSVPLINEVLKDLNMSVTYYSKSNKIPDIFRFSYINMYNISPVTVIINDYHLQPLGVSFKMKLINDNEFSVHAEEKDVWLYNYEDESITAQIPSFSVKGKYKFGELVENEYCSFKIIQNSNYDPEEYSAQDLLFVFNDLNRLAEYFQAMLNIRSSGWQANVAEITFTGASIQMNIDFVNGIINKYIEKNLDNKNRLAITTIEYIDNQLSNISDSLVYTERQLQNFRRDYNVMNIEDKAQQINLQLNNLEAQRVEIANDRDMLRQLDLYLKANEDSVVDFIPASLGLDDPLLTSLLEELRSLNTEKERLISTDQLRNPRLQTVNTSIVNLKNAIRENIRFRLNVTNTSLEEVDNKIAELNFEFSKLPQAQRQLLGIQRKFNLTDAVYTSLMEKRLQAQIAQASSMPDCEVIEPPRYTSVESPKQLYVLIGALLLGFFLPSSYILGRKLFTEKISDPDEISQHCQLQRLGYIPYQKKTSENVMISCPDEPICEYFRSIRTNLDYFLLGKKHKNILITSSLPQEGKSFISINIASSLAISQQKTLLIGFDLRKKNDLYDEFGFRKLVGLSSYLVGKASLEDIIISTKIENLDMIVSGDTPPNPVELISSDKTKELMQEVRQMYDYVIIDTPPFGLVSDAFILTKYSDLNIFVVRINTITKKILSENMNEVQDKNLNNTYLIVNSIKVGSKGYYGYKGYPYRKDKNARRKLGRILKSRKSTESVS